MTFDTLQVPAGDPGAGGCICGRENGGGRRKSERAEGKGWKRGRWGRGGNGRRRMMYPGNIMHRKVQAYL